MRNSSYRVTTDWCFCCRSMSFGFDKELDLVSRKHFDIIPGLLPEPYITVLDNPNKPNSLSRTHSGRKTMKVYNKQHSYYCCIDLHARTMYVCILDNTGKKVFHKNIPCNPKRFLQAIEPFRSDIVIGVECIFCWYWLADLCEQEGIDFILGHALYMKAIHRVKTKNDRIDSLKIARLIRGGNFPVVYVYPPEMRVTRDLMRRRNQRLSKKSFIQITITRSRYACFPKTWHPFFPMFLYCYFPIPEYKYD